MADFGDDEFFLEFEKDRESQGTFLHVNAHESDDRSKSTFIFQYTEDDSSDESSSDEGTSQNESGAQTSTSHGDTNGLVSQAHDSGNCEVSSHSAPERTSYQDSFQLKTLKKFTSIIDSTKHLQKEESPAIQIIYHNSAFARKHRPYLEGVIADLLAKEKQSKERLPKLNLRTSTLTCVDLNDELPPEFRNNAMWEAHAIIGAAQYYPDFMVDTMGWPIVDGSPALTPGYPEVIYEQIFTDVLGMEEPTGPSKRDKPKQCCFNCEGDHTLNDCKLPRDFTRINKNRQAFRGSKKEMSNVRYHESPELSSKYAELRPGHVSKELREALGLQPHQLPSFIYRMRALGYPPGWMAEASSNSSGLVMFDKDGNETNLNGESLEDGEINNDPRNQKPELDVSKIIEYPGFTVPVPEHVEDEFMRYNMPPLQPHQLKTALMKDAEHREKSRKRRLEREEERKAKKAKKQALEDMELCEEEGDNSQSTDGLPSPGHLPSGSNSPVHSTPAGALQQRSDDSRDAQSPTLETLQEQYRRLQDQISNMEQSDVPTPPLEDSQEAGTQPLTSDSQSQVTELSQESQASSASSLEATPRSTGKTSLSSVFSTPVRASSITGCLPDREKFAVGAEDHLLFENLENSTGTFDRLRGLLRKVKEEKEQDKNKS